MRLTLRTSARLTLRTRVGLRLRLRATARGRARTLACRNHSAAVTTMPIMADITIDSPMAFCTSSLLPLACAAATRGVRIVGIVEVTMEHVEYTWLAAD